MPKENPRSVSYIITHVTNTIRDDLELKKEIDKLNFSLQFKIDNEISQLRLDKEEFESIIGQSIYINFNIKIVPRVKNTLN